MDEDIIYVGLDVHKERIAVAVAEGKGGEPQGLGLIPNQPESVAKLTRTLQAKGRVECCYEAGPCGYGLLRQLRGLGVGCQVVAPSLIPQAPGDRVKTDRRDARKLARLLRSGDLTSVWVPDEGHETLRDLSRARDAAVTDLGRARQRLTKLLLRQGITAPAGMYPWTVRHVAWLDSLRFPQPGQQVVFEEYRKTVEEASSRVARLEAALAAAAVSTPLAPLIKARLGLRGIGLVTAVGVVAELGDLTRFPTARQLMAYVGVVPREASSGNRRQRGGITKTGNSHVRRLLVEAAWHYRHRPYVGKDLARRQKGLSEQIVHLSWRAQQRLCRRFRKL
ncbi:MAG: IS110 family transposase, partial [Chloroflexota bacterium]